MEVFKQKRFDELKATGQLPSPTGVAMQILRMAQQDGVGLAEVARVIKGDPALAGRLLQLVNSSYYAGARAITAVNDAVTRLGLDVVWQVALGFSVISGYRRGVCKNFDYDEFWSDSLGTAVSAQILSKNTNLGNPEEAFTCGLLSQVGRLALACIYPDAYSVILAAAADQPSSEILKLEQKTFAMDHRELASAMLRDWGLDESWVQAVRYHEDPVHSDLPEGHQSQKLAWMMHAAAQLGAICVASADKRGPLVQELLAKSARIGIPSDRLVAICDHCAREWISWGGVLGIKTRELPPFSSITDESRPEDLSTEEKAEPVREESHEIRALVVDEDPTTMGAVRQKLPPGSRIMGARKGQDALRMALEFDPQLIITDWAVPGVGGLALCKALRKTKAGQQVYILMLAHKYDEELLASALEAGANEYIMKPILPRVLEARINVALRVIRLQQEVVRDREQIRHQLADLAVLNRMLEQAALTDPLTSLPNRRYALDRLDQEWSASIRNKHALACMHMDLDHFKKVNDTYGHDAGDRVLREISSVLRKALRTTDVLCRVGGEEFLVICRETTADQALVCAERLRQQVEEHRIEVSDAAINLTISIGIAERDGSTGDPEALIKRADLATYASKTAGRNRVSLSASDSVPPPA
jgi:diguanylate cyclase (GGDEF)-like protein